MKGSVTILWTIDQDNMVRASSHLVIGCMEYHFRRASINVIVVSLVNSQERVVHYLVMSKNGAIHPVHMILPTIEPQDYGVFIDNRSDHSLNVLFR